jgi:large conductance mechanosensitive channel
MLQDFRKFAMRGNVVDMAVGIILGAAFGSIVNSLVSDVILPPIGLLLGRVDFSNLYLLLREGVPAGPYGSLADAQAAGAVSINFGLFINSVLSFLIVALAVFLLIRSINRLQAEGEQPPKPPASKECPYCREQISIQARRCPHCTSQLEAAPEAA